MLNLRSVYFVLQHPPNQRDRYEVHYRQPKEHKEWHKRSYVCKQTRIFYVNL